MIQFDSLIITPLRSNNAPKGLIQGRIPFEPTYFGKVDYLIRGDIRYSTSVSAGGMIDMSGFNDVYTALTRYASTVLGSEITVLGTIIVTPTTITIRLPYGARQKFIGGNASPGLRQDLYGLNKIPFSSIDSGFEELVTFTVDYLDTQARSELQSK